MLKHVIKYYELSKLYYNDKRIITASIFLIGACNLKKMVSELVLCNFYAY